MFLKSKVGCSF